MSVQELSSPPEPSFHTAYTGTPSSSATSEPAWSGQSRRLRAGYRPAKELPYELRQHCTVYLEEGLYSQALTFLSSILTADNGDPDDYTLPAFVPPPSVLSLAATLIVHPSVTTRAPSTDDEHASDDALCLLQEVNAMVGPSGSSLPTALQFTSTTTNARRDRRRDRVSAIDSPDLDGEEDDALRTSLANRNSLWSQADDFWAVVGWAFNCSVRHPKRWARWKSWLDFMLNVLEDDLTEKAALAQQKRDHDDSEAAEGQLDETLIAQYLRPARDGRMLKRRIMRAILADGGKKSVAEFPEVWKNETKERKAPSDSDRHSKRRKLAIDDDEFADYLDLDDSESDTAEGPDALRTSRSSTRPSRPKRLRSEPASYADSASDNPPTNTTPPEYTASSALSAFGGLAALGLRHRLMGLISHYTTLTASFMDTEDLFDLYTEFLRPLPLPLFQLFIQPTVTSTSFSSYPSSSPPSSSIPNAPTPLPSGHYLPPHLHAALVQNILRPLLSHDAPIFRSGSMMQSELERHFLPFAANAAGWGENAKVAVCVAVLAVLLWAHGGLSTGEGEGEVGRGREREKGSLRKAVEGGTERRRERARGDRRRKGAEGEEEFARKVLEVAERCLAELVGVVEGSED